MSIMLAMVALFPLSFFNYGRRVKVLDAYLGGANVSGGAYQGAAGGVHEIQMSNYYLTDILNEERIFRYGVLAGLALSIALAVCLLLA